MIYKEDELKKLQSILTMMLVEIKRVCDENGIKYFLYAGTLIGAVRHQGFIPWDDDLDIAMPREDYDRFMEIADKAFIKDMFVENIHNCEGYGHVFGKVMLRGTVLQENFTENVTCYNAIYIDVFPIDVASSKKFLRFFQVRKSKLLARMLLLNRGYKYTKKGIKKYLYKMGYLISGLFNKTFLLQQWESTVKKYSDDPNGLYLNFAGTYSPKKESYPRKYLVNFIDFYFEKEMFSVPAEYDKILSQMYGDYMQLPPIESRIAKHNAVKIDFGDY